MKDLSIEINKQQSILKLIRSLANLVIVYDSSPLQFFYFVRKNNILRPILQQTLRPQLIFSYQFSSALQQFLSIQNIKMFSTPDSKHLKFSRNLLHPQQSSSQPKFQKNIHYAHTISPSPDEYHTQTIKTFKRQLDEMRRDYEELRKAYFYLLGYRAQGSESLPKFSFMKQKNQNCKSSTFCQQSSQFDENSNLYKLEINDAIGQIDHKQKKLQCLTQRLTQSIIEYKGDSMIKSQRNYQQQSNKDKISRFFNGLNLKISTIQGEQQNVDQSSILEKENKRLKQELQNAKLNSKKQIKKMRSFYSQTIKKLEEVIQREKKQSQLLNGTLKEQKKELLSKDKFIKLTMKLKTSERSSLQKVLKTLKLQ